MAKYFCLLAIQLIFCGCTINITSTITDTHGKANDVVDTSTSTEPDVETTVKASIPASIF
jgi:hypothetical protein